MSALKPLPLLTVALRDEADIVIARRRAREVAALMGFEAQDQTRIATAVSEIARNAATYGGGGRVEFAAVSDPDRALQIIVRDKGAGIPDLDRVLDGRFKSVSGMGIGIAGTRRLMDGFDIVSSPAGTAVTLVKHLPRSAAPVAPGLIGQRLAAATPSDPVEEARLQNRELMESLAALVSKQEETERLNDELAVTNRGVVALYAELDEKAAQLAALNQDLENRVEAAVADAQRVGEALRQSQKMEAVGQLTGGIAHDFNNLLQIVLGNLELVLRRLPPEKAEAERLRRAVGNAMSGAQRAATLTQRLLAFSRRQPLAPKPVDINKLVDGMSDLMRRTLGETVTIETHLADGLWIVEVDANQLENALLNLAVNARDAMPGGGTLTITTGNDVPGTDAAPNIGPDFSDTAEPGQYTALAVTDTGTGMTPETMARVFEPFFTTKEAGKGTGLGLSMVYGFVKQSGGHLRLRSALGQGTTITLHLPRFDGTPATETGAHAPSMEPARRDETILVVEDDPDVRAYSCDVLTELGYAVLVAPSGAAAIAQLDTTGRIDLIFTDMVLAGPLNGHDVATHAARVRPGLPVLFASGYAHEVVASFRPHEPLDLLAKPFSYTALATRVRQALTP